jgi:hypothetical protein
LGRHAKDGIRIGVAQLLDALIVSLPGPNDEVKIGMESLVRGLNCNLKKQGLAAEIAYGLQVRLREKMKPDRRPAGERATADRE